MSTQNIFDMVDTWNASGTTFTAIRMNVTDTASAAGSLLMDLQVGGSSRFSIDKDTIVTMVGSASLRARNLILNNGVAGNIAWGVFLDGFSSLANLRDTGSLNWTEGAATVTMDLRLFRDAANTLAQRNGTNAQTFRLYQSFTDASNFTRLSLRAASAVVTLEGESAGTGEANIDIALTPKGTGRVRYGTHSAIGVETVTGFIEIKDAGGTVRKVAIVS